MTRELQGLRLRLDRPKRRNSITDPIVYALVATLEAAASDESVRVIHLSGTGDHFCSGADIVARNAGGDAPLLCASVPSG